MTRLIIIGIDGMDPYVFERFQTQLPHLSSILKSGSYKHCNSVFPPDSIPAWVTIFTGEYPEKHGWLDDIDYEEIRRGVDVGKFCDLKGKTFWDKIGQAGKRVCIVNPLLAYPVWPVNGIMVNGPIFITGEKQIYPNELAVKYDLPELGGMTGFPAENELERFLEECLQSTRDLAKFGLDLLKSEKWDLYFLSFFSLDRIQHFLWRFSDISDPLYPGPSSLDSAILTAYKTFDEIVGKFLGCVDSDTGLIVLSDHGHGQRPTMVFNLNEALRQAGLLNTSQELNTGLPLKKIVEITKNVSIRFVVKILGENWLYRIGRLLPKKTRKALKKSSYLIDKENSVAWVSDLGGGASVGGVVINPKYSSLRQEYKKTANMILERLEPFKQEANGHVIQWAKDREEDSFYPDIIFELDPNFSVGRSLFCPIVEKSSRHRIISGGHKKEGILFTYNCGDLAARIESISDIHKGVLSSIL